MSVRFRPLLPVLLGLGLLSCDNGGGSVEMRARSGTVMGTVAELKVAARDEAAANKALEEAFERLVAMEEVATPHADTSELARLNEATTVRVSREMDALLTLAQELTAATDGAFDPTTGGLVAAWGFPDKPALPDSATVATAVAGVGADRLRRVGDRAWEVDSGTRLDLGGIAKGWGVDRAADLLGERYGACLVNVGGDLAVRGTKPGGAPWRIGVQDPRDPSRLFVTLELAGTLAVATSGDYQRFVEIDGIRYHHLLDPRTGWPARDANSATVVAPSCALADAWATAAFVLGANAGIAALEAQPKLEGVVVTVNAQGELVRHETTGFAAYQVE